MFTICSLLLPYGYQVTRADRIPPARYIVIGVQRALALVGALDSRIGAVIGGAITLVISTGLTSTMNTQAYSTGAAANTGSFTGAQALNDLIPLVYIAAMVMVGVGLIGMDGAGYMGMGPMRRRSL